MENEKKERSNVQDMVKGALIIAVIFFHCTLYGNATSYNEFNIVFCIFPCIMGVFFFYTGYNYTVGKRSPIENIKRRTKQLLIPLLVMIVVDTILVGGLVLIYNKTNFTDMWKSFIPFLLSEGGLELWNPNIPNFNYELALSLAVLWYLYTLYIISIIFYLIVDKVVIKLSRLIPVVSILVILSFVIGQFLGYKLPYAIQSYPLMLAIMLTGAYFSLKKELDKPIDNKKSVIIAIIQAIVAEGIIFGIGIICYYAFSATTVGGLPGGALNNTIKGFDAFIAYIMAILGTFLIHTIMRLLNRVKILALFFGFLGKRVSIVYVTHPIFIAYIHTIIFRSDYHVLGWFQPYAYTIITLVLFIGIAILAGLLIKKINTKNIKVSNYEN